jgi:hypothetical protein
MSKCQQPKTICRVVKNKENPYVIINKTCLHDPLLSMKAKGVLCYMLSMPDDWVFHREELVNHFSDGITTLRSALKELEEHGYLKIICHREKGKVVQWETLVFESPALANSHVEPEVENPLVVTPPVVNHTLLNTDTTNNERTNSSSPDLDELSKSACITKERGTCSTENLISRESEKRTEPEVENQRLAQGSGCQPNDLVQGLESLGFTDVQAKRLISRHGNDKVAAGIGAARKNATTNPKGFLNSWLAARNGLTLATANEARTADLEYSKINEAFNKTKELGLRGI